MGFGSAIFLFGFLPLTALLFHLLPWSRGRRLLLLLASLFFYAFGRLWDLPILLASAVLHYGAGRLLLRLRRGRKAVVAGTVILDLGLLAACKYLSFFASAVNLLPGIALTVPSFPLPLGISFFTFQGISYVVDAYRNREQASRAFFRCCSIWRSSPTWSPAADSLPHGFPHAGGPCGGPRPGKAPRPCGASPWALARSCCWPGPCRP